MGNNGEIPRYKCNKVVRALQIGEVINHSDGSATIRPKDKEHGDFRIGSDIVIAHRPTSGGYYIFGDDDYESFKSAHAFESGYNKITEPEERPSAVVDRARILRIAEVAHEANRAYCQTIGDMSQMPWPMAPEWQREIAINGIKFHLDNPDSKPEDSHNSWLKEKEAAGWKYGPVEDADKKEHPCCVPYGELPEHQKVKDRLFISVVRAFSQTCTPVFDIEAKMQELYNASKDEQTKLDILMSLHNLTETVKACRQQNARAKKQ